MFLFLRNFKNHQHHQTSLQSIEQTKEIGASSCVALNEQNETLARCDQKLDESELLSSGFFHRFFRESLFSNTIVDVNLNKSERLLRGMSGFWGRVVNAFTRDKTHVPFVAEASKRQISSNAQRQQQSNENQSNNSGKRIQLASGEQTRQLERQEEMLDALSAGLADVRHLALDMNAALDDSDRRLDVLHEKTERANARHKKINHKIWRMT
jgi:hypothetical protein